MKKMSWQMWLWHLTPAGISYSITLFSINIYVYIYIDIHEVFLIFFLFIYLLHSGIQILKYGGKKLEK